VMSPPTPKLGQISMAIYNAGDRRYFSPAGNYLDLLRIEQNRRRFIVRWTLPF